MTVEQLLGFDIPGAHVEVSDDGRVVSVVRPGTPVNKYVQIVEPPKSERDKEILRLIRYRALLATEVSKKALKEITEAWAKQLGIPKELLCRGTGREARDAS